MRIPTEVEALRPAVHAERRPLALAAALGALAVLVDLARPWPLALAVDAVVAGHGPHGLPARGVLLGAGVAVVVATAATGWIELAATVRSEQAAERVGARLRHQLFDHAVGLSLRWHDAMRSGELSSRLTTDVGRLLDALVAVSATLVPDVLRLAVVLGLLFVIDPWLALVGLLVIPALALLAGRQRRRVRTAQDAARAASGRFAAVTVDLLRNVRAVQAFGRDGHARHRFGHANAELLAANSQAVAVEARWSPLADATLALGTGLVLVVGGLRALSGDIDAGQLIVAMSYLATLYSPVRSLSRLSGVLAKAGASARRVHDVLACGDRVAAPPTPRPLPALPGEIRFSGVHFGYQPGRPPALDGVGFSVGAGETVCLMGPSGAGKSTILHLLLRLYDVDAGAITIDGVDLRDVDPAELRRRVAFVPQDPWLLDATVADNIAFGTPHATRHGLLAAARIACVDEFVDRLPDGYDTVVGEGGAGLSGGQRRRIALARAVVSDAPILLLDEPTASLDPCAAAEVVTAMRAAARGRTVLLVTHDRELARIADRVVEIPRAPATAGPACHHPTTYRKEVSA